MNKKALLLIIPFAAAGLAGCERANPNPPGPTPDPQCESATVNIKSAGDVTTIKPTATLQLTAEVNISGCTFDWKSSDSAIATVDANGLVTGVKAGDVVISYGPGSFNLKVDDDAPTPPPTPVDDYGTEDKPLSVTQAVAVMQAECTQEDALTKQVIYCTGVVKEITKSGVYDPGDNYFQLVCTDNTTDVIVYRVHATDELKDSVQLGAQIKWVGYGKNFKGTLEFVDNGSTPCTLLSNGDVPVSPTLVLSKTKESVKVGADVTISATVRNTENAVQWSLLGDSGSFASITPNGNSVTIHGIAKGTAKVKAAIPEDNLEAVCEIEVKENVAPATVNVEYSFSALKKDDSNALDEAKALAAFTNGKTLGDDIVTAVAPTKSYSFDGALRVGTSGNAGSLAITTSANVTQVVVTARAYKDSELNTITIGSQTETVEVESTEFVYSVSSTKSITIDTSKRVLIEKIGFVAEGVVPVDPEVVSVAVTPKTADLPLNGTLQMSADVVTKGTASKEVNWFSSDESKATVDANGLVTPHALGEVTITAKAKDNESKLDTATITVVEEAQDVLETISASGYTTEVEIDTTYEFNGEVYGHYSLSGDVKLTSGWTVTTNIDTSSTGDKTGVITYSKDDVVKTCNFTVTVKPAAPTPAEVDVSYSFAAVKDSSGKQYTSETLKAEFTAGLSKGDDIVNTVVPTVLFGAAGSLKPGNKTGGGSIEINTTKNIVGVVVTAKDYGTDGSSISVAGEESALTAVSAEYAASFAACKSVTISTTKRAYIEAIGFVLEGSTPVTPAVNGVTVSPKTANLDLTETTSVTLSATVDAVGGAEETVTWSVVDADPAGCVTVDNGVVTAVAEGSAKVVATSTFNTEKSDYCEVSVLSEPAPQPELESISVDASKAKTTYTEGESVVKDGLVVTAHYTNGGEDKVLQAAEYFVSPSGALTIEDDTVTVTYEGKTDTYAITVSEQTAEKGTLENPYTAAEAKEVALGLTETTDSKDVKETAGPVYIKGTVSSFAEAFSSYGNYSFWMDGNNFEVWRILNGVDKAKFEENDIAVGDEVIICGKIMNFKGTAENTTDAYVYSVTRGQVSVSVDANSSEQAQVDLKGITSATNGSTINFDVTANSGYEIVGVESNGVDAIKGSGNSYSITVYGPVSICVETKEEGSVTIDPYEVKFADHTSSTNTDYTKLYDVTIDDIAWKLPGNQSSGLKIGGKGGSKDNLSSGRYIASQTAFENEVKKIELAIGSVDADISVTSVTLTVHNSASDAASGTGAIDTVEGTFAANATTLFKAGSVSWAGKYFRISFVLSSTNTSNKGFVVNTLKVSF